MNERTDIKSKQHLIGMTRSELEQFVLSLGEKKFRGRQIYQWIYQKDARSFDAMTDLSTNFRDTLPALAEIGHLTCLETRGTEETGSVKYLFRLSDGECVESVLIPDENRRTLCVSAQIGCALNCRFCATAKIGFHRNLTSGEIVDQLLYIKHATGKPITNVVYMGMGEPFQNYTAVIKAADLMSDPQGMATSPRRIVISTAGIADKIIQFTDEGQKYRLALSLNSPFQDERRELMPVTRQWNLDELLQAARYYTRISGNKLTFEYVLFAELNDTRKHALALKDILKSVNSKLNLIPYNAVDDQFKRPGPEKVDQFVQWLLPLKAGLSVRWSRGTDIKAACGQLAGEENQRKIQSGR
ncbi:MAG: 23S rRNA (adenine(2503)-C(2))-methyltransferase RlmN [candidate division KSB1 bacterium]|nr:23S rRNA (adenine(2503)-C(2))-methyltransferase RlmN [candidate division KSB1 bacterium]